MRPTAADLDLLLSTNDVEPPKQLEEMDEETQRQLAELDTGSVALVYETKGEGMCKHCASFIPSVMIFCKAFLTCSSGCWADPAATVQPYR